MKKKFLTIFYYKDIGPQHLYKDVGSIPLGLSKYCGWESTFAYVNINGEIKDRYYERYVKLIPVYYSGHEFWDIIRFLWDFSGDYDVINFYHFNKKAIILAAIIRYRSPSTKLYCKLDMDRRSFDLFMKKWKNFCYRLTGKLLRLIRFTTDLYTVESTGFYQELKKIQIFKEIIQYAPNGFWKKNYLSKERHQRKDTVILTVGRLGTLQKNTELLLNSFAFIPAAQRKGWRLILIGEYTPEIMEFANQMIVKDTTLQGQIQFIGNIEDKNILNYYYSLATIFCLPSRWESFGIALIEAIHYGCFPIVTDCCEAFEDILDHGRYGVIVANEDQHALSEALRCSMLNAQEVVRLGKRAKEYVDEHFDYESIAMKLSKVLENIFNK